MRLTIFGLKSGLMLVSRLIFCYFYHGFKFCRIDDWCWLVLMTNAGVPNMGVAINLSIIYCVMPSCDQLQSLLR